MRKKRTSVCQASRKKLRKKLNSLALSSIAFCLLTSCGYRVKTYSNEEGFAVEVPYIQGDSTGSLTSSIIGALSESPFYYTKNSGDFILEVKLVDNSSDHIGYKYDSKSDGTLTDRLIPIEGRSFLSLEIRLLDANNQSLVLGPFKVRSDTDFDFVNSDAFRDLAFSPNANQTQSVLNFSFGQLDSWQDAEKVSKTNLNQKIAKQVAALLSHYYKNS